MSLIDKEAVITITDEDKNLVAIVRTDPKSRKHIIYRVKQENLDGIQELLQDLSATK